MLGAALFEHGVTLTHSYQVDAVTEGSRWCNLRTGTGGVVDSRLRLRLAAEAVFAGRRIVGTRAELEAELVRDEERAERVGALIGSITPSIAAVTAGRPLTDECIAAVAVALDDGTVRDVAYRDAAEATVWVEIARALPDPWRSGALVMVAVGAYLRSDGPRAGVALEAALMSDPTNRMAWLLDSALQQGMPPSCIRQTLSAGE